MKKKKKIFPSNPLEMPTIIINPELNKYKNVLLFPKELEKANAILSQLSEVDKFFLNYSKAQNGQLSDIHEAEEIIEQADLQQQLTQKELFV